MSNHAIVFGASGISGWAITNALLDGYPTPELFSKVSALTNRPLSPEIAQWPPSHKLQVISGVDLLQHGGQHALENDLRMKVADIESVTHVYFSALIKIADPDEDIKLNVQMLERAVGAIENLSKNLKFVVLPTGTKVYGVHLIDNFPFTPPLHENLPRIPEPYASKTVFYYRQTDRLKQMSEGKNWTWCELRPDVVIGFVPNNNISCLAQVLAPYFVLYHAIEGAGAEVPFPGTSKSWTILSNDSSQDIIAKFAIFASLHPEKCGGQAFNVADNRQPSSWSQKWPVICEYFDLKGVAPPPDGSGPQPGDYVQAHMAQWKELEQKYGLHTGHVDNDRSFKHLQYGIMTMLDFDRQMDLAKELDAWGAHAIEIDTKGAWWTAFDRFRKAGIIP
ncbi:hypothetical protein DFH08DRAFT_970966 [Mycena albidolilacea]|uniref:PRISE-like Rossmann-fold domain-containing protein n=1 Tax=Mycena albidolilacea TaxID=1033008 RepID=A0AAD6ZET7_9AGAR|nr:hypothetical protein DFH08DRAFT_970966 [Mycena albidolilacea]